MEGRGHGPYAGRRDQKGDGKNHNSQPLYQALRQHKQVRRSRNEKLYRTREINNGSSSRPIVVVCTRRSRKVTRPIRRLFAEILKRRYGASPFQLARSSRWPYAVGGVAVGLPGLGNGAETLQPVSPSTLVGRGFSYVLQSSPRTDGLLRYFSIFGKRKKSRLLYSWVEAGQRRCLHGRKFRDTSRRVTWGVVVMKRSFARHVRSHTNLPFCPGPLNGVFVQHTLGRRLCPGETNSLRAISSKSSQCCQSRYFSHTSRAPDVRT